MSRLTRIAALAAATAGALRFVAQFIPWAPDRPGLEALYAVIDIGFLLAMVGLVAHIVERVPGSVLALLLAALVGVASIVGPDRTVWGIDFYVAGSALFTLALAAAAPWLARIDGLRPAALAWGLAGIAAIGVALGGGAPAFAAAGLLLALGFLFVAPTLWRWR